MGITETAERVSVQLEERTPTIEGSGRQTVGGSTGDGTWGGHWRDMTGKSLGLGRHWGEEAHEGKGGKF